MKIKDRIREFRRVPASELAPHPMNWRTHGEAQANALRGVLAEVGIAAAAIAYQLPDGTLRLIDGHLRAEEIGDNAPIPTLILDVTEEEAAKLLATFDPLGAMAGADADKLAGLLEQVATESEAVQALLDRTAAAAGLDLGGDADGGADPGPAEVPEQFQILVICKGEKEQARLLERFAAEGLECRSLIS